MKTFVNSRQLNKKIMMSLYKEIDLKWIKHIFLFINLL